MRSTKVDRTCLILLTHEWYNGKIAIVEIVLFYVRYKFLAMEVDDEKGYGAMFYYVAGV